MPTLPPVYLNHLLVFVDAAAYREIAASRFLRETFAWFEERTTHDRATGMSWTGVYCYGQRTYFEFMHPEATSWAPRDGIAFGVEAPGGGHVVADRLRNGLGVSPRLYTRTRQHGEQAIPWFEAVELPRDPAASLITWGMAYCPEFLSQWETHLPPADGGVARQAVLTRYRARVGDTGASRLFEDVAAITVHLPEGEAGLFREELRIYGYEIADAKEGFQAVGPDITIRVEHAANAGRCGIRSFTMRTQLYDGVSSYRFGGGCALNLPGNATAEWVMS